MTDIRFKITKKDLDISYFSGSGAGGQHRNRHNNCVRLKHRETGVIVTGQSHKERIQNIKEALQNLAKHPKVRSFCYLKLRELEKGKTNEQQVEELMEEKNLVFETLNEKNQWVKIS